MFDKLVLANLTPDSFPDAIWSRIQASAREVVSVERGPDDAALKAALADADGLIVKVGETANAQLQDSATNLRYIGMHATGFGGIDISHAMMRGIVVTNVPDYSTESVAELAIILAEIMARNVFQERDRARSGDVTDTEFVGRDLSTLTFGVVGAGYIGQRVVQRLQSYDSEVLYWSRNKKSNLDNSNLARHVELDELLQAADIVSLHLAASAENLINAGRIAKLRDGAILVNTAPNEILDLGAVFDRCQQGSLRYAMDHADELKADQPGLFERMQNTPNVEYLPPIGYATAEASARKPEILVENIEAFLAGSPIHHVNPAGD